LFRKTLKLSIVTSTSLILGLLSHFYILFWFGVSSETDAHITSLTLPALISSLLVVTLPQILVPVFVEHNASTTVAWYMVLPITSGFLLLTTMLYLLAPYLVPFIFFGLDTKTSELAIELTRIQAWSILAAGLSVVPVALLRARERVLVVESYSLLSSLTSLMILIPAVHAYGIIGASIAIMTKPWIQFILVVPSLGIPNREHLLENLYRTVWRRFAPILYAAPLYKLGPLIDRMLAAIAPLGDLSALAYGQQIWNSGLRVTDRAAATPFLTHASLAIRQQEMAILEQEYRKILKILTLLTASLVGLFWLLGGVLVDLLTQVGSFRSESAFSLWSVTLALGGMFIAGSWSQVSTAAMYSLGLTHFLTRVAMINFLASSLVKVVLFLYFGIIGLALGCVLYPLLNHLMFHRKFLTVLRQEN